MANSEPPLTVRTPDYSATLSAAGLALDWQGQTQFFSWGGEALGELVVDQQPRYAALWGPGTRFIRPTRWGAGLTGALEVSVYADRPGLVISGQLGPLPEAVELDRLALLTWDYAATEAGDWRWLINSGHQGFSGSVGLTAELAALPFSQDVTVLQHGAAALAMGNLSFARTNVLFERALTSAGQLRLEANLAYGGLLLPAGEVLTLEALLLLPHTDALAALEAYAEGVVAIVQPQFHRSLVGLYNQWYAHWTPTSDHGTADLTLNGAQQLHASGLPAYGIAIMGSGVWQNRAAFSEDQPWPGNFPEGLAAVSRRLSELGLDFMHGGFWGKVSGCATVAQAHPDWLVADPQQPPTQIAADSWGACSSPAYLLDITRPEAQAWFREQWRHIQQSSTGFYWLDFHGTGLDINLKIERPAPAHFHDRSLAFPFETDRLMTGLIRETLGSAAVIGVYTSPTFNLIGLIDRARVALDVGALDSPQPTASLPTEGGQGNQVIATDVDRRWGHVQAVARNVAAAYFCHNRFWINDADPAMVGLVERPETLEEARVRLMIAANSGGFVTVGETPERMAPTRLALLKQILPPYGQAARPLDLLDSAIAGQYDLVVETSWDTWHCLSLISWGDAEQTFSVPLGRLGLTGPTLAYEYWEQRFLGLLAAELVITVPARSGRLICLRPARAHPWLLSTNLHVSQGALEVSDVAWDADRQRLTGQAQRPDGHGRLLLHAPPGYRPLGAYVNEEPVALTTEPSGLVSLALHFSGQPIAWAAHFEAVAP